MTFMLKCLTVKYTDVCNLLPALKNKTDGQESNKVDIVKC